MCELSKKENCQYTREKPKLLPQLLSAIGVSFGATLVTGWVSFTSVAIPKMIRETTLNPFSSSSVNTASYFETCSSDISDFLRFYFVLNMHDFANRLPRTFFRTFSSDVQSIIQILVNNPAPFLSGTVE